MLSFPKKMLNGNFEEEHVRRLIDYIDKEK